MLSKVNGYKTYIVAVGSIVIAWFNVYSGSGDVQTAIHVTEASLAAMTIRHGMKTGA